MAQNVLKPGSAHTLIFYGTVLSVIFPIGASFEKCVLRPFETYSYWLFFVFVFSFWSLIIESFFKSLSFNWRNYLNILSTLYLSFFFLIISSAQGLLHYTEYKCLYSSKSWWHDRKKEKEKKRSRLTVYSVLYLTSFTSLVRNQCHRGHAYTSTSSLSVWPPFWSFRNLIILTDEETKVQKWLNSAKFWPRPSSQHLALIERFSTYRPGLTG